MSTASAQPFLGEEGRQQFVKDADKAVRAGFIRKVYGILSMQLLLTVLIALPFQSMSKQQLIVWAPFVQVANLSVLVLTIAVVCCCSQATRTYPYNYMFLAAIAAGIGVTVGFVCAMYTMFSVLQAAAMTVTIFLGLTVYAFTTETDFTGCGPYLMAGLMGLMVFGCSLGLMNFFGFHSPFMTMLYNFAGIMVFIFYIVFDTQLMMGGSHQCAYQVDDYANAALQIYLDIINLFMYILQAFGERRE